MLAGKAKTTEEMPVNVKLIGKTSWNSSTVVEKHERRAKTTGQDAACAENSKKQQQNHLTEYKSPETLYHERKTEVGPRGWIVQNCCLPVGRGGWCVCRQHSRSDGVRESANAVRRGRRTVRAGGGREGSLVAAERTDRLHRRRYVFE